MAVQVGEGRPATESRPKVGLQHRAGLVLGFVVSAGMLAALAPPGLAPEGWQTGASDLLGPTSRAEKCVAHRLRADRRGVDHAPGWWLNLLAIALITCLAVPLLAWVML